MPSQSKGFQQQDLPLQGQPVLLGVVTRVLENVHPQPEFLSSHQHVCTGMDNTSLSYTQGDPFPQDYKNNRLPVSQNVMSSMQGAKDFARPPLMDSVNALPSEAEGPLNEGGFQVKETSGRSCSSCHIIDPVIQEDYNTYETTLPVSNSRSHQTEDLQMHNSMEVFVNPAIPYQEDMETCNDSSNNELRNEPMDSDENGKEHTLDSCSSCRPPPCSTDAFPLMMADSEHNPSTSGYSSEQPAKAKTQKELMKILKDLRSYLPPEKRLRGKSSTTSSLRHALHCIQQVKANEEYYQLLMVNNEHSSGQDLSCYTVQEIANITSEFTKNNMIWKLMS